MTKHMKRVLQEDDCAPDARDTFAMEFVRIVGISMRQFMRAAEHAVRDDGSLLAWRKDDYELQISADDPYYSLWREEA